MYYSKCIIGQMQELFQCLLSKSYIQTEPTKPSKVDRRANTGEFTPVDEEEFSSVSSLIRGRVKLQDVNKVIF